MLLAGRAILLSVLKADFFGSFKEVWSIQRNRMPRWPKSAAESQALENSVKIKIMAASKSDIERMSSSEIKSHIWALLDVIKDETSTHYAAAPQKLKDLLKLSITDPERVKYMPSSKSQKHPPDANNEIKAWRKSDFAERLAKMKSLNTKWAQKVIEEHIGGIKDIVRKDLELLKGKGDGSISRRERARSKCRKTLFDIYLRPVTLEKIKQKTSPWSMLQELRSTIHESGLTDEGWGFKIRRPREESEINRSYNWIDFMGTIQGAGQEYSVTGKPLLTKDQMYMLEETCRNIDRIMVLESQGKSRQAEMERLHDQLAGMRRGKEILKERNDRQRKKILAGGNKHWASCEALTNPLPPCLGKVAEKQASLYYKTYTAMSEHVNS